MPKSYLWGLDENGYVFSLSSWDNCWQRADSSVSKIKQFKAVSSSLWSIWCIGIDNQIYIYVPCPEIKIRTTDNIVENQRREFAIYSGKNLKLHDPPEFATSNYYGKLIRSDLKTFSLPSTRWEWEDVWKIKKTFNGEMTDEGWIYSNNFMQKFQNNQNRLSCFVRRRFWQRYRYFHATERWLLVAQDSDPFEITCNQECGVDMDLRHDGSDYSHSGIIEIGVGGEMLPHQKDGFISVWTINEDGQVLYRLEVHRQNPEGSKWCLVKLPPSARATCLSVGPLGHLLVYCSHDVIYFRENVTWKNPIGSSWTSIKPPEDLVEDETIVQLTMSVFAIWARSNRNRVWFRNDVNLHENNARLALGREWSLTPCSSSWICCSPSGQLWGLPMNGNGILYRLSHAYLKKTDRFWSGFVNLGFGLESQLSSIRLAHISAHGLFVEDDIIPPFWLQSSVGSRSSCVRDFVDDLDWRQKIMDALIIRDYEEFKNPSFSNYTSLSEQVSWSKASDCQVQSLFGKSATFRWLTANVILHHKLKDDRTIATMHINVSRVGKPNPDMFSFLESDEILCTSKYSPPSKGNVTEMCTDLVVFVRKKEYTSSSGEHQSTPRVLLKFSSEVEVEDWILALNFVMRVDRRNHIDRIDVGRIWFLNKFYEPFYVNTSAAESSLGRCYQNGGHFRVIESCAKGRITWALGFNGIAWVNSNGWGGSYLGLLCSSKDDLSTSVDVRAISVIEFEKFKFMPGNTFGKFSHYMWTDEYANVIRDMDGVTLSSRRWQWYGNWSVDHGIDGGECDKDGWQYSTSITHKFDSNMTWTKNVRRRRWTRYYKTSSTGPWKEVLNDATKIVDVSLSPEYKLGLSDDFKCVLWAVTDDGRLLRRRGVTLGCPEGFQWLHIRTDFKIKSASVNREGDLWVVCTYGSVWRLRQSAHKDVRRINDNDWQLIKHPNNDGKFIMVSSGDQLSAWAVDSSGHLWTRMFTDTSDPSSGTQWVHVCDQAARVSCATQQRVVVLFTSGSFAERLGISTKLPQGTAWSYRMEDISSYVSIRGA